jgi:monofunctional glycosyltransferase
VAKAEAGNRGRRRKAARAARRGPGLRRPLRWAGRGLLALMGLVVLGVVVFAFAPVPTTHTIWSESRRLGGVARTWVPADRIAPVMLRSLVAAEDANFCLHWGFDMNAIRQALDDGARRGASTLSQQTVKNVFLWQERSWPRKALEATLTPVVEAAWSKRRILEVYLNVAEFGEGVFGIEAAARHHYGVSAADLTAQQAARLAAVLPNPKARNPRALSPVLQRRAAGIADGAETIRRDGRAACFES